MYDVLDVALEVNPSLEVWRVNVSAVTATTVVKALADRSKVNRLAATAVDVRNQLDIRAGYACSRFQRARFCAVQLATIYRSIKYGLCLTPTMGLIAARDSELTAFISAKEYRVICKFLFLFIIKLFIII